MSDIQILRPLSSFVKAVSAGQPAPQRKFIFEGVLGIALTATLIPARWAEALRPKPFMASNATVNTQMNTQKMRFSRNLASDRLDDELLTETYLNTVDSLTLRGDGAGVIIPVDLTDIQHPYAKKVGGMEHICGTHDGSEHEVGWGYPVAGIDAWLPDGNQVPLRLYPFSFVEDGYRSQWGVEYAGIQQVAPHVGGRAIWTFDRGYDSRAVPDDLDKLDLRGHRGERANGVHL